VRRCNEETGGKIGESFVMSILETEDTDPGPGYFEPNFDFCEKKSFNSKQTFTKGKRFKKKKEKENFTLFYPDFNVNK